MPRVIGKVEGRGNGIKTVIFNVMDLSLALKRDPGEVCKFFGTELGAQVISTFLKSSFPFPFHQCIVASAIIVLQLCRPNNRCRQRLLFLCFVCCTADLYVSAMGEKVRLLVTLFYTVSYNFDS